MTTLSERERRMHAHFTGCATADEHYHREDVEAILSARLAKVEALAGEWETPGPAYARALRAALASDPTHAQDGQR